MPCTIAEILDNQNAVLFYSNTDVSNETGDKYHGS